MKKSLSFALLLSLGAFSHLSFAEQTLRFGVDPTFPPFESKASDGSLKGFGQRHLCPGKSEVPMGADRL